MRRKRSEGVGDLEDGGRERGEGGEGGRGEALDKTDGND